MCTYYAFVYSEVCFLLGLLILFIDRMRRKRAVMQ
jgi:hypothetical protein